MRFAVNYSPAAARLYESGLIDVDLFKCPDFPEVVAAARMQAEVYVHFPLESGPGTTTVEQLDEVAALAGDTGTRLINTHAYVRRRDYPALDGHGGDTPEVLTSVIDRVVADVAALCARFGPDRVIVENVIYTGREREDFLLPGVRAELLREVIRQTGCGLLLDLSHARISCQYADWEPWEYLDSLPVDRLRELHVTGLAEVGGVLTDHMPLTEGDLGFFSDAMRRVRSGAWATPEILAFEYGGVGPPFAWRTDPGVIAGQVPMLRDLAQG